MIDVRIGQLSQIIGVHRNTISNWIKSGKLKAKPHVGKRYLIEEAEFNRFCREARIPEELLAALTALGGPALPAGHQMTKLQTPPIERKVRMPDKPIGSVLVVGGGIAGIQASIDLANSGYAVHLVERSAGIGGAMAQLDKTYPTNDCAM
ncbi:MAG: helix-turn-helix domain-containing protein [Desulfobacteraceae bacterium]|nr:MAG: helix-turn-helix domain-containing protein [Desulfobacteraceae bacterium]